MKRKGLFEETSHASENIPYVLHDMAENLCNFMHDNHRKFRRTAFSTFCQDTFTLFGCY